MIDDSEEIKRSSLLSLKKSKKRRIVFLGAPGVGKSAIIIRFIQDIFVDYYNPTIETVHKKNFSFQEDNIELEILDYDGQTEYTIMNINKFSHGIHAYVLCYSIENLQSFELINILYSKISKFSIDVPKIIVGNKSDLSLKRVISYEDGRILSIKLGCKFVECSAKNATNIKYLFHETIVEIYKSENNLDIGKYCCKKLLRFFSHNQTALTKLFYSVISLNMVNFHIKQLFSIYYIIQGFYIGLTKNNSNLQVIQIGLFLFVGFWNFLFGIIGIYGIMQKKREYVNYFKISLIIAISFLVLMSLLYFLVVSSKSSYEVPEYIIYIFITNLLVKISVYLTAYIFQTIQEKEVVSYFVLN